jgi:hypothetical protein
MCHSWTFNNPSEGSYSASLGAFFDKNSRLFQAIFMPIRISGIFEKTSYTVVVIFDENKKYDTTLKQENPLLLLAPLWFAGS